MTFVQASAKDNHNIQDIFTKLAQLIIEEKDREKTSAGKTMDSVQLAGQNTGKNSGGGGGCKC